MNRALRSLIGLVAVVAGVGCGGALRGMVHDTLVQKGEVLREWKVGEQDHLILREGNRVVQYRIYSVQMGMSAAAQAETVYAVDTVTRTCFAGAAQTPIPCVNLQRDRNMRPYLGGTEQASAD